MKIIGHGNDDETMRPYRFHMEGKAVAISPPDGVTIEVRDLVNTVVIHASYEELQHVIDFCKTIQGKK